MRELVDYILYIADKDKIKVTQLQLHKVSYFALGYLFRIGEQRLAEDLYAEEHFQAWTYGPVLPETYQRFRKYVSTPILDRGQESERLSTIENFNNIIKNLMTHNVFDLVERSHQHNFWADREREVKKISDPLIQLCFATRKYIEMQ